MGRVTVPFPDWIEPMAATLTHDRFAGPEWSFERKFDGIRLLAFKQGPDVRLLSRNRLPQNAWCPSIVQAVAALPVGDAILDGEAIGVWRAESDEGSFHVFDLPWLDGRDLREVPLEERRAVLGRLPLAGPHRGAPGRSGIELSDDRWLGAPLRRVVELTDERPWERAAREGWEGVIAKRRDSLYESRRSPHWLKMKCEATQELVVGGFTDPQGGRVGLGALLVGYFDGDDFAFAGRVGTGFDTKLLLELRARLGALEIDRPPFTRGTGLPRLRAHWVRPEVVVQVAFVEWTVHGKLRHPRLLGLREDKPAREVRREMP